MADEVKKKDAPRNVSEDERFKFIGFEVYPGKPKDLFKNEAEKAKLVEAVREKRQRGEVIREECTLFDERVSWADRIVLTLASVVIVAAVFLPWFAIYNEVVEANPAVQTEAMQTMPGGSPEGAATPVGEPTSAEPTGAEEPADVGAVPGEPDLAEVSGEPGPGEAQAVASTQSGGDEVIHGYVARKKVTKEYTRVSGIGALAALGSVGGIVFSSGLALMLTAVLIIAYILLCVALPVYTLYGLWALKGTPDERSVQLKLILRYSWLPLMIFGALIMLSFFGGEYSGSAAQQYESLGESYGIGVFLDSISWGIIVTLAASILVAAKGSEI